MEKINLFELEHRAKAMLREQEIYSDYVVKFDLCGPLGRKPFEFLDVYMGLVREENVDGFIMLSQLVESRLLWAENLRVEKIDAAE